MPVNSAQQPARRSKPALASSTGAFSFGFASPFSGASMPLAQFDTNPVTDVANEVANQMSQLGGALSERFQQFRASFDAAVLELGALSGREAAYEAVRVGQSLAQAWLRGHQWTQLIVPIVSLARISALTGLVAVGVGAWEIAKLRHSNEPALNKAVKVATRLLRILLPVLPRNQLLGFIADLTKSAVPGPVKDMLFALTKRAGSSTPESVAGLAPGVAWVLLAWIYERLPGSAQAPETAAGKAMARLPQAAAGVSSVASDINLFWSHGASADLDQYRYLNGAGFASTALPSTNASADAAGVSASSSPDQAAVPVATEANRTQGAGTRENLTSRQMQPDARSEARDIEMGALLPAAVAVSTAGYLRQIAGTVAGAAGSVAQTVAGAAMQVGSSLSAAAVSGMEGVQRNPGKAFVGLATASGLVYGAGKFLGRDALAPSAEDSAGRLQSEAGMSGNSTLSNSTLPTVKDKTTPSNAPSAMAATRDPLDERVTENATSTASDNRAVDPAKLEAILGPYRAQIESAFLDGTWHLDMDDEDVAADNFIVLDMLLSPGRNGTLFDDIKENYGGELDLDDVIALARSADPLVESGPEGAAKNQHYRKKREVVDCGYREENGAFHSFSSFTELKSHLGQKFEQAVIRAKESASQFNQSASEWRTTNTGPARRAFLAAQQDFQLATSALVNVRSALSTFSTLKSVGDAGGIGADVLPIVARIRNMWTTQKPKLNQVRGLIWNELYTKPNMYSSGFFAFAACARLGERTARSIEAELSSSASSLTKRAESSAAASAGLYCLFAMSDMLLGATGQGRKTKTVVKTGIEAIRKIISQQPGVRALIDAAPVNRFTATVGHEAQNTLSEAKWQVQKHEHIEQHLKRGGPQMSAEASKVYRSRLIARGGWNLGWSTLNLQNALMDVENIRSASNPITLATHCFSLVSNLAGIVQGAVGTLQVTGEGVSAWLWAYSARQQMLVAQRSLMAFAGRGAGMAAGTMANSIRGLMPHLGVLGIVATVISFIADILYTAIGAADTSVVDPVIAGKTRTEVSDEEYHYLTMNVNSIFAGLHNRATAYVTQLGELTREELPKALIIKNINAEYFWSLEDDRRKTLSPSGRDSPDAGNWTHPRYGDKRDIYAHRDRGIGFFKLGNKPAKMVLDLASVTFTGDRQPVEAYVSGQSASDILAPLRDIGFENVGNGRAAIGIAVNSSVVGASHVQKKSVLRAGTSFIGMELNPDSTEYMIFSDDVEIQDKRGFKKMAPPAKPQARRVQGGPHELAFQQYDAAMLKYRENYEAPVGFAGKARGRSYLRTEIRSTATSSFTDSVHQIFAPRDYFMLNANDNVGIYGVPKAKVRFYLYDLVPGKADHRFVTIDELYQPATATTSERRAYGAAERRDTRIVFPGSNGNDLELLGKDAVTFPVARAILKDLRLPLPQWLI